MILAITTATAACSIALIDDDEIVAEEHVVVGRGHAERLVPMIAALPNRGRADAIMVDCGPGSFTGVRVGLAAARALALAWSVPLSGFSTLALIAAGIEEGGDGTVGIATQGGHGELFVETFSRNPLATSNDLRSLTPEDAAQWMTMPLVAGSGAEAVIALRGSGRALDALPRAANVRLLPPAMRARAPSPIYGRPPDAVPQ